MPALQVITKGGLGNRLLAIIAGIRLHRLGIFDSLSFYWQPSIDLNCPIDRLLKVPYQTDIRFLPRPGQKVVDNFMKVTNFIDANGDLTIECCRLFTHRDDPHDPGTRRSQFIEAASQIEFTSPILDAAADTAGMIGVHARRTDFPSGRKRDQAALDYYKRLDAQFATAVASQYPNRRYFVASDSFATTMTLLTSLGERASHTPKRHYPGWKSSVERGPWCSRPAECVLEGAADLISLSRSSLIVADSNSTFAGAAALIGGKPRKIWERPEE